jgi:hypothetical protein
MRDIKDYLHLYMGCSVLTEHDALMNGEPHVMTINVNNLFALLYKYKNTKPLLRSLSDMTEEEAAEVADILGNASHLSKESKIAQVMEILPRLLHMQTNVWGINWIKLTVYLLSKGFDLFNLIPDNLALDSKLVNH